MVTRIIEKSWTVAFLFPEEHGKKTYPSKLLEKSVKWTTDYEEAYIFVKRSDAIEFAKKMCGKYAWEIMPVETVCY